jgi:hypothetical protein
MLECSVRTEETLTASQLKVTTNMKKKIGMIAGGSGITPMLQVWVCVGVCVCVCV